MIQVSRKKMLCAKRQRVGFCRGFFWRHEKSEKTLHFIHEATNTINTPPPAHCLRPGTGSQKTTFEGASEDERPCDQGEGENLKLLRLQNSFHYRSVSKIFQTCSVDFGSNIILIALIAILDKV
jgi:hypothetical protein